MSQELCYSTGLARFSISSERIFSLFRRRASWCEPNTDIDWLCILKNDVLTRKVISPYPFSGSLITPLIFVSRSFRLILSFQRLIRIVSFLSLFLKSLFLLLLPSSILQKSRLQSGDCSSFICFLSLIPSLTSSRGNNFSLLEVSKTGNQIPLFLEVAALVKTFRKDNYFQAIEE